MEAKVCIRNTVLLLLTILLGGIVATVLFVRISSQKETVEFFTFLIPTGGTLIFILIPFRMSLLSAAIEQRAGYYSERLIQALTEVDYKTEESLINALVSCIIIDAVFEILYFIITAAIAKNAAFTTTTLVAAMFSIAAWVIPRG